MHKFIALQKIPRAQTLGLTAVSIEHKRANLVKDAPHSERAKALTGIGLRQIRPEERVPELQYGFQRLGYVGAYVVNAPSEQVTNQARQLLEPDYHIMPDIQLSLPFPTIAESHLRRGRLRSASIDNSSPVERCLWERRPRELE